MKFRTKQQVFEAAADSAAQIVKHIPKKVLPKVAYIVASDACKPHPNLISEGVSVYVRNEHDVFELLHYAHKDTQAEHSTNHAEWSAFLWATRLAMSKPLSGDNVVVIATDSQLVANQATGVCASKKPPVIVWVSGKANHFADAVSRNKVPNIETIGDREAGIATKAITTSHQKNVLAIIASIESGELETQDSIIARLKKVFKINHEIFLE